MRHRRMKRKRRSGRPRPNPDPVVAREEQVVSAIIPEKATVETEARPDRVVRGEQRIRDQVEGLMREGRSTTEIGRLLHIGKDAQSIRRLLYRWGWRFEQTAGRDRGQGLGSGRWIDPENRPLVAQSSDTGIAERGSKAWREQVEGLLREGLSLTRTARMLHVGPTQLGATVHAWGWRYVHRTLAEGPPHTGRWIEPEHEKEGETMKDQPWDDDPAGYAELLTPERERQAAQDQAAQDHEAIPPPDEVPTLADEDDRIEGESPLMRSYALLKQAAARFDAFDEVIAGKDKEIAGKDKEIAEKTAFAQSWYEKAGVFQRERDEALHLATVKDNEARAAHSEVERLTERLKVEISKVARMKERFEESLLERGMSALTARLEKH